MANFAFWASLEDRLAILRGILELKKYQLLGSDNNPTPEPTRFEAIDAKLLKKLEVNKVLYLSGAFTTSPISFQRIEGGNYADTHVIRPQYGGPLLILSLPGCKCKESGFELAPGHLYYSSLFFDNRTRPDVMPSPALKEAFKEIQKTIRKHVFRNKQLKIWVGRDAWKLLMGGHAKILVRGKWLSLGDAGSVSLSE